ncbi:mitochondrial hypoxia induced protein domain protein [Rhodotorula toruloides]|uniref:Mitochondrial hypoxia induced protein domain protein n=1 Tax=Rhodotorula toruloides TaxID=5286 RepID=A0A511KC17_RHOTO|nr:mitochondrial hypoxia induced protein domain protein [Rhodotorula toruloides]
MPAAYTPDPVVNPEDLAAAAPVPRKSRENPGTWEKFSKKFKEEPLVPIGCIATVAALLGASSALQKGNRTRFNQFLRFRVAAQGFTVIAALGGSLYYQSRRKAERKADELARQQEMEALGAGAQAAAPPAAAAAAGPQA